MRASMSATDLAIRDWTSAASAAQLSTLSSPPPAESLAYSEESLSRTRGAGSQGKAASAAWLARSWPRTPVKSSPSAEPADTRRM